MMMTTMLEVPSCNEGTKSFYFFQSFWRAFVWITHSTNHIVLLVDIIFHYRLDLDCTAISGPDGEICLVKWSSYWL